MVILAFRAQALEQRDDPITVAILGGDRVAGQALELLLQGVGCDARFVADPVAEGAGEWLEGVQVLLLPPTLRPEHREAMLAGLMSGAPGTSGWTPRGKGPARTDATSCCGRPGWKSLCRR